LAVGRPHGSYNATKLDASHFPCQRKIKTKVLGGYRSD
jgi:hypothetical protein